MVAVMALDGAGYLLAVSSVDPGNPALISLLQDIFVAVAILTITVGLASRASSPRRSSRSPTRRRASPPARSPT